MFGCFATNCANTENFRNHAWPHSSDWSELAVVGVAIAGMCWLLRDSFLFAGTIERDSGVPQAAHGIVALTGGKDRIGEAVRTARGRSGETPSDHGASIRRPRHEICRKWFRGVMNFSLLRRPRSCGARYDRQCGGNQGLGCEARFQFLIVVTSAYHMPRTLIEFARACRTSISSRIPLCPAISRSRTGGRTPEQRAIAHHASM